MKERVTTPILQEEESRFESTIRPRVMKEFVGQSKIKDNLEIFIQAAKRRGDCLDHTLLCGPPGLGETTLAYIIANEMKVRIQSTSGQLLINQGIWLKFLPT